MLSAVCNMINTASTRTCSSDGGMYSNRVEDENVDENVLLDPELIGTSELRSPTTPVGPNRLETAARFIEGVPDDEDTHELPRS